MKTLLHSFAFSAALLMASPLSAQEKLVSAPEPKIALAATTKTTVVALAVMDLLFAATLGAVLWSLLRDPKWSLGSALSEGSTFGSPKPLSPTPGTTTPQAPAPPAPAPVAGAFTAPPPPPASSPTSSAPAAQGTFYEASASRLIAFIGMLVTTFLFFGFGNWVLWQCFQGGNPPGNIAQLIWFLGAGSSLFVPYALNQARGALEDFAKLGRRP